ncbi:MAG: transcriptional regulator, TetR family [Gemmatimonadetes bacterium]|nr:transcriptional regulator, TetR family [Gemmatimonadota bacterium]
MVRIINLERVRLPLHTHPHPDPQMTDGAEAPARTARGEQTRALIVSTAIELFRERGYEETTMRAVAERAGVALGSAYYYFRSKDELVQTFYARTHEEHLAASAEVLRREPTLRGRLAGVMRTKLETIEPYHQFAGVLFRSAADPASPLNPFSEPSRPVREQAVELFAEVVRGATDRRVPPDLRAELPHLLWLYHMGIILFWIHDATPGRRRTRRMVDLSVDLIVRAVAVTSSPLMRPLRTSLLRLLKEVEAAGAPEPEG